MRKAKIVCTLGPATTDLETLCSLVDAGMDVARLNMSHGEHDEHQARLTQVRQAAERCGRPLGVFADLQGPKIRLGKFGGDGKAQLVVGERFTITTEDIVGDAQRCSTTFKGLPGDVSPGDQILIDDGRLALEVEEVTDTEVVTHVVVGGPVSDHKGINLPGVAVSVPALSEKDTEDLRWALRNGVDMIALSFVRSAADIEPVHAVMEEEGRRTPVIAKIEKPQAIEAIEDIVDAFDAVMVARGDLGVELPLEDVPLAQKRIIDAARRWAKPAIVATQMLESMITAPRPTRAEASDVANAVFDGADAVMLSGETSVGQYPVEAVQTMARIVDSAEKHGLERIAAVNWWPHTTIAGVMAMAGIDAATKLEAKYLVTFTKSGDTAKRVSRLRSGIPHLVFTSEPSTQQLMTLLWGAHCQMIPDVATTDEMVKLVDEALTRNEHLSEGDIVVIVYGSPVGVPGHTNTIRAHRIRRVDTTK